MSQSELTDFAIRYAAAWSSQNPASLGAFYAENGSLTSMPVLPVSVALRLPQWRRDS
jgi:hypothetical protein